MFSTVNLCDPQIQAGFATLMVADVTTVDLPSYELAVRTNNQQAAIVADWQELPFTPDSGRWSEDGTASPQGVIYRTQITCELADNSAATRADIDQMRRRRYLVQLRPRGSTSYILIGTIEQPMAFADRFDSNTGGSGEAARHQLQFEGNSLRKNPYYVPTF